jgi:expansin (peptidoglycan-binding protein)
MALGHHRRGRSRLAGRRFLLGFGITGAGLAAIAIALVVGIGQMPNDQACTSTRGGTSALSLSALSGPARSSGTVTGIATHYVLEGLPNCSYESPPANGLFVALSPSEYASAGACGGYLEVSGPDGSAEVEVIDQCPECATGHIDLSEAAFAKLAPLSAGLINVSYTYLANPVLPGPITMEVKSGSSQYWLALLAGNTGNPLASVQVKNSSGSWISLSRANYNYWIASSGAGPGPFTVRLTDTQGHQVTVENVGLDPGSVQSTGTYMYGAGSAPAPVPTPPPASASSAPAASPSSPSATAAMTTAPSASASPSLSPTRRHSAAPSPSSSASPSVRASASAIPQATDPQLAMEQPIARPAPSSTC